LLISMRFDAAAGVKTKRPNRNANVKGKANLVREKKRVYFLRFSQGLVMEKARPEAGC
jgi:hypothetical protein